MGFFFRGVIVGGERGRGGGNLPWSGWEGFTTRGEGKPDMRVLRNYQRQISDRSHRNVNSRGGGGVVTDTLVLSKLLWRGGLVVESVVDSVKGVVLKMHLPSVLFWFSSLLLDGFLMIIDFGSSFFFVL